jgi:predicted dehydrogenase
MASMRSLLGVWSVRGVAEASLEHRLLAEKNTAYKSLPWVEESALLADSGIQAVAVETALADATAAAARVVDHSKHLHLDKPGGTDLAAFSAMRRRAEERGLIVQMGYMLRYNPAFVLLMQAVREGWLGAITEIDCSMGKLGDAATRAQIVEQPGGAMFEIGCHLIDMVVTLLGPPRAVTARSTPTRDDGVPDNQLAVLEYASATACVRANFADPFGGPRRRFNVTGTRGTIEILPLESGKTRLMLTEPAAGHAKGVYQLELEVPKGRYDGEFLDLARCIRERQPMAWDAAHDIAVFETSLRASGLSAA